MVFDRKVYQKEYSKQWRKNNPGYGKQNYVKNKVKFLERNLRYKKTYLEFVNRHKTNGCMICKESDPICLEFHHIDPSKKEFNIGDQQNYNLNKEKLRKEIEKCVVVCANCHKKIHNGNLKLPVWSSPV